MAQTEIEHNQYLKILDETMHAAQLVNDSVDHFNDILEIAKTKHAPDYTRQLLSMEFEQLTKACRGLKDYEHKFKAHENASKAVLSFVHAMNREFEEAKEKYESFMKNVI